MLIDLLPCSSSLYKEATTMSSHIKDNDDDDLVRPFEWLTSPESLLPILREAFSSIETDDPPSPPPSSCNVLHVGSGGSVLGEFLVEHEQDIVPKGSELSQVVNLDKDQETLDLMQTRWQRQLDTNRITYEQFHKVRFQSTDLVEQGMPFPDETFQVILDKSTLDCTLCSDTATAWLLHEVYRLLDNAGGVYVLISFHHIDLLLPLLQECPGCSWTVTHSTMTRQVEDLISSSSKKQQQQQSSSSSSSVDEQSTAEEQSPSENNNSNWNNTDDRQQLRILMARRTPTKKSPTATTKTSTAAASVQEICDHVHHTNDSWYKLQHPILTPERCREIRQEFEQHGPQVPLEKCFSFLFTEAEREHLTYDYFLEDWEAFLLSHESAEKECMTLEVALTFLEEMQ